MRKSQDSHLIWGHADGENLCYLETLNGFKGELDKGGSLAKRWPSTAWFNLDPEYYKHGCRQLGDNIPNPTMVIVASPKLAEFLQSQGVKDVEYLPVKLKDHRKKRVLSKDYRIVHVKTVLDAVDMKHSKGVVWNTLNPKQVHAIERLVLTRTKRDHQFFRLATDGLRHLVFVRHDLAAKLEDTDVVGLRFWKVSDFIMR
ncbi:Imm43 family immunity protein [Myxococcota bacterium]